jgi:SAM-dependent methyltransferase
MESDGKRLGFVRVRDGKASIDWSRKTSSLISNGLILEQFQAFLEERWGQQRGEHILDLGAGLVPYAAVYGPYFDRRTTVDVPFSPHDQRHIDVFATADDLPFEDATFDCILCTEMLEHCPEPLAVLAEMHRVLKPGGAVFLTTPFSIGVHEAPYDFYRYTPFALRHLAEGSGFEVMSIEPRGDYGAVTLGNLLYPFTLFWAFTAARTDMRLYGPKNPIVLLTVIGPQLAYLALWRRVRRSRNPLIRRVLRRTTGLTLGYMTTLERPTRG